MQRSTFLWTSDVKINKPHSLNTVSLIITLKKASLFHFVTETQQSTVPYERYEM